MKKITLNVKNEMDMNNSNIPSINDKSNSFKRTVTSQNKTKSFVVEYKDHLFEFSFSIFTGPKLKNESDYAILKSLSDSEYGEFMILMTNRLTFNEE